MTTTQTAPRTDQQLQWEYEEARNKTAFLLNLYEQSIKDQAAIKAELVERGLLPDTSRFCPLCWPARAKHEGDCIVELDESC